MGCQTLTTTEEKRSVELIHEFCGEFVHVDRQTDGPADRKVYWADPNSYSFTVFPNFSEKNDP